MIAEKQLTPKEFERTLLNTFRGKYVNPKNLNSWHSETLYTLFKNDAKKQDAKMTFPYGKEPVNPRSVERKHQENKGDKSMLQNVGFLKQKSKKEGTDAIYDLEINLPFHPQQTFYVIEHTTKDKDSQPDFSIFHARHKIGSMWKRTSEKKGTKFLSGNIFALGIGSYVNNKTGSIEPVLQFNVFESKGKNSEETQQVVCISYGEQKADDPEEPF
jgi:uncharacterized protein (DUF736 family)